MDNIDHIKRIVDLIDTLETENIFLEPEKTIIGLKQKDFDETFVNIVKLLSFEEGRDVILNMIQYTIDNSKILFDIKNRIAYYKENGYPDEICERLVEGELPGWSVTDKNMKRFLDYYNNLISIQNEIKVK